MYRPGELTKYVPEALGNRQAPTPIAVWIKRPAEHDKRKIRARGGDNEGRDVIVDRLAAAIRQCVTKVEHYSRGSVSIDDGEKLATHGEDEVFFEVAAEILRSISLSEDESKKYDGSRACGSAATLASSGTADPAQPISVSYEVVAEAPNTGSPRAG